jgi:hypothetical protein
MCAIHDTYLGPTPDDRRHGPTPDEHGDLLNIISFITNNSERKYVINLTTLHMKAMRKYLEADIKTINLNLAYTKSPYLVSLFSQVKEELRKLQDLLAD